MRKSIPLTIILMVLLSFTAPAHAWWIFGDSGASDAMLQGVTINSVPYENSPRQLVFYPEFLPSGKITVKGKALAGGRPAQTMFISINARETWEQIPIATDGTFTYTFRPAVGAEYGIYLKAQSDGKTNDIQRSGKLVRISELPLRAAVNDVLNKMIAAYREENSRLFMSYVSPNFAGDDILLARAIRKDFSALDNIDLRFSVDNMAIDAKGKVAVTIRFNRTAVATNPLFTTAPIIRDSGTTQMVFTLGDHGLKLYSMKIPLLFGLSDAPNVSSGVVRSSDNSKILVINSQGKAFEGNTKQSQEGASPSVSPYPPYHPPYDY